MQVEYFFFLWSTLIQGLVYLLDFSRKYCVFIFVNFNLQNLVLFNLLYFCLFGFILCL